MKDGLTDLLRWRTILRGPGRLLAWLALPAAVSAQTFTDDFSTGVNGTYWNVVQTTPGIYSLNSGTGDIDIAKIGTNPGGLQNIGTLPEPRCPRRDDHGGFFHAD